MNNFAQWWRGRLMTGNLPTRIMLLQFIITISACRSDTEILGPHSQYLPKIVSIFAEVMHEQLILKSVILLIIILFYFPTYPCNFVQLSWMNTWMFYSPICIFCRFCAMEQNSPLMKLETGWWMSWGVSSRLCLLIFLHQRFPTCNRSNSYCYSPSCRHSCFFSVAARSGLVIFLDVLSANSLCGIFFLGGVICECIACFNELEAATTHGFDIVYIVLYSKYGLRRATEVQGKW